MDFTIRAFCGAGDPDDSLPTSQVYIYIDIDIDIDIYKL